MAERPSPEKSGHVSVSYSYDELVGFVMLYDEALRPQPPLAPEIALWRLMVDERFRPAA
jgi:hypothetical protein